MKQICAGASAGAEGCWSYMAGLRHDLELDAVTSSHSICNETDEDMSTEFSNETGSYGSQFLGNAMQPGNDLDLTQLLELGRNVTLPNPLTRMTAVRNAMSTISRLNQATSPIVMHSPGFSSDSGSQSQTFFSDVSHMWPRPLLCIVYTKTPRVLLTLDG